MSKYLLLFGIVALFACNQETVIGTDLISDQVIDFEFTDTISLEAKTIKGDSLIVFVVGEVTSTNLSTVLLGEINDIHFGKAKPTVYFNIALNPSDNPNFENVSIDSAVLSIPLDTLSSFGDTMAMHTIELFELAESMENQDTFRTNDFLELNSFAIASESLVPRLRDSLFVYNPNQDSTFRFRPHLRLEIDDLTFVENLMVAAMDADNDTIFRENVYGFGLQSIPEANSIFSLNMSNDLSSIRELTIYYTDSEDNKASYSFPIGARRTISYEHDYTGSAAFESLTDQSFADSLLYIQAMQGLNIEVDLSSIKNSGDEIINYAELELTVVDLMSDDPTQNLPIDRVGAFYYNDENNLTTVDDLTISDNVLVFQEFHDGILNSSGDTTTYSLKLTNHVLDVINESVETQKIIISAFNKQRNANRSIIYGTEHSVYPLRLKIVRTKP